MPIGLRIISNAIYVSLLRKGKKRYYENLNLNCITDNKKFWKTVKPFFSDKHPPNVSMILRENRKVISDDKKCAEVFNQYFATTVDELDIDRKLHTENTDGVDDPILGAITKYRNHPSILKIKEKIKVAKAFNFCSVSIAEVKFEIQDMDSSKAAPTNNIPIKVLKNSTQVYSEAIQSCYNLTVAHAAFPNLQKNADISPIFKQGDRLKKNQLHTC